MVLIEAHFTDTDFIQAKKEMNCAKYCVDQAYIAIIQEDYKRATAYFENALRSIKELNQLNEKKKEEEKIMNISKKLIVIQGLSIYTKG